MREARYIARLAKIARLEQELMERAFDTASLRRLKSFDRRRAESGVGPICTPACACHGVLYDAARIASAASSTPGRTVLGLHASGSPAGNVAALIDHTLLKPDATQADIETLCREAAQFGFAILFVNPCWVALAARLLRGTKSAACSVVGFPLVLSTPDVKHYETRRAIFDGAAEIDMVINIGALKSGDLRVVERDIEAVTAPCRDARVLSKVIIEASYLTDQEKITASTLAKAAGADFVKTSTGFGPGGATVADVALMRRVVGAEYGRQGRRGRQGSRLARGDGGCRCGACWCVRRRSHRPAVTRRVPTTPSPAGY